MQEADILAVLGHHVDPVGFTVAIEECSLWCWDEGVVSLRGHFHTAKEVIPEIDDCQCF